MRNLILFVTLSLYAINGRSQTYDCLQYGVKHFYLNSEGYLRGMRIDSIQAIGSDTVYCPFHTMRNWLFDTAGYNGGSWLGKNVIKAQDGTWYFDNIWHDTIIIKSQANLGDAWLFYNDSSTQYYMASVTGITQMTFMGITDSVKVINITAYNNGVLNIADPLNNFQIMLSKSNGFVSVFDLYIFPYHALNQPYSPGIDSYLEQILHGTSQYGLLNFNLVDYHDPTGLEIYNFEVGDAFERYDYQDDEQTTSHSLIIFDSVTAKTIVDDYHVQYDMVERVAGTQTYYPYQAPPIVTDDYSTNDTYGMSADSSIVLSAGMPEDVNSTLGFFYFKPDDTSHCYQSGFYEQLPNNYNAIEPCDSINAYKAGFIEDTAYGCLSDLTGEFPFFGSRQVSLFYSLKNSNPCGQYRSTLSTEEIHNVDNGFKIFPNPANNIVTILNSKIQNFTVSFYNVLGQLTLYKECHNKQEQINLDNCAAGLYSMKIVTGNSISTSQKLVIAH